MLIYILIYIGLLFFSVIDIFPQVKKRHKLFVLFFWVVVFTLFRGLRWETGTDWQQFYECFQYANWNNIFSYDRYGNGLELMESGYMLLNCIVKVFGDYTLFLTLTNLWIVGSWAFLSFKLVPEKPIMTFAFILVSNLFFPVRLQLAASIFIWATYAIYKNKFWLAICILALTYFFHKSAIMLLPFLFVLGKHLKTRYVMVVFIVSMLGEFLSIYMSSLISEVSVYVALFDSSLSNNLEVYSDCLLAGSRERSLISVMVSFLFAFFLLNVFCYARKLLFVSVLKRKRKIFDIRKFNVFFNSYILFNFFYKFFSAPTLQNFSRVSEFFTIGCAVCMMLSYSLFEKKYSHGIMFSFFVFYYIYKFNNLINGPFVQEYQSVFSFNV